MDKPSEIINKAAMDIVEYVRYIIVSGIALISLRLTNDKLYSTIISESKHTITLILAMMSFGVVLFFLNRTFWFPILEKISDWKNACVFRTFVKKKNAKMKYYEVNDLWIIIQDEEGLMGNLSKYKLWRASIEMMSGVSIFFLIMLVVSRCANNYCGYVYYSIAFTSAFFASLESNINFERRLFNIFLYKNDGSITVKINKYIKKIKSK